MNETTPERKAVRWEPRFFRFRWIWYIRNDEIPQVLFQTVVEDLENEAADADEYPLTRADIAQLNEFAATEHAVKLAIQRFEPDATTL